MTVLWVAQAVTVTNGQKEVVVTSAPGNAITKVETSAYFHGVGFSLPYEIERTYNNGTNDVIVLYENWAGSSGSIGAVAAPSGAAVTRAANSLEELKSVYEAIADSLSTTATANSIPQRDSNGRLKAAPASAGDDVMVKSQFSDGAFGPDCTDFGVGLDASKLGINADDYTNVTDLPGGLFRIASSSSTFAVNSGLNRGGTLVSIPFNADNKGLIFLGMLSTPDEELQFITPGSQLVRKVYHSGNANFNTWSIGAGRVLSHKAMSVNPTSIDVELNLNSWLLPTGVTVNIGSCDIIDVDTGTTVYSDLTPTLAPPSHRKLAILRFTVSGATTGKLYRVIARSSGFGFDITF